MSDASMTVLAVGARRPRRLPLLGAGLHPKGTSSLMVGALLSLLLATRFALMYPERTRRLALVNPIGLEDWKRKGVPYRGIDAWRERELGKDLVSAEVRQTLGRYDQLGEAAAEAIPHARLVELNDVGHLPLLEAYPRYIDALRSFLQ